MPPPEPDPLLLPLPDEPLLPPLLDPLPFFAAGRFLVDGAPGAVPRQPSKRLEALPHFDAAAASSAPKTIAPAATTEKITINAIATGLNIDLLV